MSDKSKIASFSIPDTLGNLPVSFEEPEYLARVLGWLLVVKELPDLEIRMHKEMILKRFGADGIGPGINTHPHYKQNDPVNQAQYIMGQALEGIKKDRIPDRVKVASLEWGRRFKQEVIFLPPST